LTSSGSERRGILVNLLRKREVPRPRRIITTMHGVRDADIARVCKSIRALAGGEEHSESKMQRIREIVQEAYFFNDSKMGEEEALKFANGFKIDPQMVKKASDELTALGGRMDLLARQRQSAPGRQEGRISLARLLALDLDQDDPDMIRLKRIIEVGIEVPIKEGFVHQSEPPPLRQSYLNVAPAVEKTIAESVLLGNAVIVDAEATKEIVGNINFSALSWIPQPGPPAKPAGRTLVDSSHPVGGADALNTEEVKQGVIAQMGDIVHPTVVQIAREICSMAEKIGWENVRLYKMDVKGAFTLVDFKPEDVQLLAVGLTGGRTYFPLAGVFGLTIMPFVFNVVTKVLSKAINKKIWGVVLIYVDDMMGITHVDKLAGDMKITHEIVTLVLGPGSVADNKTESGSRLTLIGWDIDASREAQDFAMSEKNLKKAMFAFFELNESGLVTVKEMQTIASLASRYALVSPGMKPYTGYLYESIQGRHVAAAITLSEEARACIARWRAFFCQLMMEPEKFRRKLTDLTVMPVEWVIEYDASLYGVGTKIFRLSGKNLETETLMLVSGTVTPFELEGDSGNQNTMEFIAVVIGLGLLAAEGVRDVRFRLRGDNKTSLAWSQKQRFKTGPSEAAAVAFLLFSQECGLRMGESEDDLIFIKGLVNVACDNLSRGHSPEELGYDPELIRTIEPGSRLYQLLELCHPLRRARTEIETGERYRNMKECINSL